MKISRDEIEFVENISSNESSPNNSFTSKKPSSCFKSNKNVNVDNLDLDNDLDNIEFYVYNPYWTLRKCSSKLLDKISCIYSKLTLNIIKPFLENDLQCEDWIKKYFYFS